MAKSIREVMSRDPIAVSVAASVSDAARTMRDKDIGAVLVLDHGVLVGILTDRDIVVRCLAEGRNPESTQVEFVCSQNITTLSPGDTVENAERLMRVKDVKRLPVVQAGRPIGIVTFGDVATALHPDTGAIQDRR